MMPTPEPVLRVPDTEHDRYATFGFLAWWDQAVVRSATVVVVGAGALGNEVLKNLALAGVGRLVVIDFDSVEASNLSRSVLFRAEDQGQRKVEVAARAVTQLNPEIETVALHGDLTRDFGAGLFRRADAVVGCLDSREARLFLNRVCYSVGKPWVDGALHEMLGEARVFWPGRGACFECTLGQADYQSLNLRYSCSSLARELVFEGKIATTPNIASIIGGIQAQETLKLLHGLEVKTGSALVYNGLTNEAYSIIYPMRESCPSHRDCEPLFECPQLSAHTTTGSEMLAVARQQLGARARLELAFELLVAFECPSGHEAEVVARPASWVKESAAVCPQCGSFRWPKQTHSLAGDEPFLDRKLIDLGIAPWSVICARADGDIAFFELTGDRNQILGSDLDQQG